MTNTDRDITNTNPELETIILQEAQDALYKYNNISDALTAEEGNKIVDRYDDIQCDILEILEREHEFAEAAVCLTYDEDEDIYLDKSLELAAISFKNRYPELWEEYGDLDIGTTLGIYCIEAIKNIS